MNVSPRAGKILRSLPDEDAARILDTAARACRDSSRRLVTIPVHLSGMTMIVMVGKPVAGGDEPVVLSVSLAQAPGRDPPSSIHGSS